jgi:hypothetical protein
MTQQQFIQQLKQQPRHGMATSWEDFFDGLIDSANALPPALINLSKVITDQTIVAVRSLTGENEKLAVGFSQAFAMAQKAQSAVLDLAKAATFYESSIKSTSKSMGIGFNASLKMTRQFTDLSQTMSGASLNTKMTAEQFGKYAGVIKNVVPGLKQLDATNKQYYAGLQQTNFVLDQFMGLSAEQAGAFTQYAASTADNSAQQLKFINEVSQILGDDAEGTLGYTKMITEGIAEAGADIQLQYGRLPGSLEVATIKAARLGLKLEDLAGAGESLLDVESSIGKELEYQLLTGKRLVDDQGNSLTNLYREATLRGNASDQADIMTKIIEDEGDNLEKNLFARKQMADLLGIQEQQLASAIQKQKIFEKAGEKLGLTIDIDDNGAIMQAAQSLKESGELSAEELAELATSLDQRGTEDLLKQQLANSNEMLIMQKLQFTQNSTAAMRDAFSSALQGMTAAQANMDDAQLKAIGDAMIKTTSVATLASTLKGMLSSGTTITQPTIGGEAAPVNDLIATPTGYGDRILLAGEDTFALNNDDTLVAGTNLFPNTSTGGSNMAAKIDELIAEIRNQTRILSKRDNTFGAGINSAYYG